MRCKVPYGRPSCRRAGVVSLAVCTLLVESESSSACDTTRLGLPCAEWGANEHGISPNSTACAMVVSHQGGPRFPGCHVSSPAQTKGREYGVCANSCGKSVVAQSKPDEDLHEALELVRVGSLTRAEKILSREIRRILVEEKEAAQSGILAHKDMLTAAHSLHLLGRINTQQEELDTAQFHYEVGCGLLDRIYGAPFEAVDSYANECYEELQSLLTTRELHRKALVLQSYVQNDVESFSERSHRERQQIEAYAELAAKLINDFGINSASVDHLALQSKGRSAAKGKDEDDDEDDRLVAVLRLLVEAFVTITPHGRQQMRLLLSEEITRQDDDASKERTEITDYVTILSSKLLAHCVQPIDASQCLLELDKQLSVWTTEARQKQSEASSELSILQSELGAGQHGGICPSGQQVQRAEQYAISVFIESAQTLRDKLLDSADAETGVSDGSDHSSGNGLAYYSSLLMGGGGKAKPSSKSRGGRESKKRASNSIWVEIAAAAVLVIATGPWLMKRIGIQLGFGVANSKTKQRRDFRSAALKQFKNGAKNSPGGDSSEAHSDAVADACTVADTQAAKPSLEAHDDVDEVLAERRSKKSMRKARALKKAASEATKSRQQTPQPATLTTAVEGTAPSVTPPAPIEFVEVVPVFTPPQSPSSTTPSPSSAKTRKKRRGGGGNAREPGADRGLLHSDRGANTATRRPPASPVWSSQSSNGSASSDAGSHVSSADESEEGDDTNNVSREERQDGAPTLVVSKDAQHNYLATKRPATGASSVSASKQPASSRRLTGPTKRILTAQEVRERDRCRLSASSTSPALVAAASSSSGSQQNEPMLVPLAAGVRAATGDGDGDAPVMTLEALETALMKQSFVAASTVVPGRASAAQLARGMTAVTRSQQQQLVPEQQQIQNLTDHALMQQQLQQNEVAEQETAVQQQIEYYLSPQNLAGDAFLLSKMITVDPYDGTDRTGGGWGWVEVELLATFPRVRQINPSGDVNLVARALASSPVLELQKIGGMLCVRPQYYGTGVLSGSVVTPSHPAY